MKNKRIIFGLRGSSLVFSVDNAENREHAVDFVSKNPDGEFNIGSIKYNSSYLIFYRKQPPKTSMILLDATRGEK